ncbi:MAG: GAF domain-containing sensor histidine kinase [Euryarchaeota archaeon]|nr:GAF domain-containing sensor histidine kinase [Euryarchaeota archaeon]
MRRYHALGIGVVALGVLFNIAYWEVERLLQHGGMSYREHFMQSPVASVLAIAFLPVMALIGYQIIREGRLREELEREVEVRKKAEKAMRQYLEELRAVHEIDRSIIESSDLGSLLEFIVKKARELTGADVCFFGLVEGDVIKLHAFSGAMTGITTEEFRNIELRRGEGAGWLALQSAKPVYVADYLRDERMKVGEKVRDAVRRERLVSMLAVPFFSREGKPTGVLYVAMRRRYEFSDEEVEVLLTLASQASMAVEHARLLEEIRRAYEELKKVDQIKDSIIANVGHELRTPITIAKGAIELLEEEEDPEERRELIDMAYSALVRQDFIVSNLLEAAKFREGITKPHREVVELKPLVDTMVDWFMPMARQNRLEFVVEVGDATSVCADPEHVEHVLRNLISNAIKFNKSGGKVIIKAHEQDGRVEVCVEDTGIGIPAEVLERVFEKFYQVDPSPTRKYGGIGLGLAIAREMVRANGGEIRVESEPDSGSRFCFTLPAAEGCDGKDTGGG